MLGVKVGNKVYKNLHEMSVTQIETLIRKVTSEIEKFQEHHKKNFWKSKDGGDAAKFLVMLGKRLDTLEGILGWAKSKEPRK